MKQMKMKQTSSLFRLDPFLDEKEVLRVGGRLKRATMAFEVKHPVIIPKQSHVTELLIRHYHSKDQHHQGRCMTHNALRQAGYWIINGRSSVSKQLLKCTTCRKLRGPAQTQRWLTFLKNVWLLHRPLRTLVWTCSGPGISKRVEKN